MEDQNVIKRRRVKNNTWTGLMFLLIGGVLLLRQSGYPFPVWLFTWPSILIAVGLFVGLRHGFRDFSWLIMIIVGFIFLADDIWTGIHIKQYAIPLVIMALGLLFILNPKRTCRGRGRFNRFHGRGEEVQQGDKTDTEDYDITQETTLDIVSVFSGIKKRVLSKQFKGGEITCVFGGAEINLMNADFTSPITLDLTTIFGGTKLIMPANWELRSEASAIFGGIDDKRPHSTNFVPDKIIILKGTIMFGGVEVNSY